MGTKILLDVSNVSPLSEPKNVDALMDEGKWCLFLRKTMRGSAEGKLGLLILDAGLKDQLHKLSSECTDASDLEISYYATDQPDQLPTNVDDLVKLIETFPQRMKGINEGCGVAIKVRN